ncbi:polysaccharide biosynthesis tyrosine autokinase [Flavobacterium sp. LAR06]|uniref:exopolysaccharide transport family protein n=1 Tax=Flavobacterium sp. LAR06 TaxID=3064897 RepID=UPI0035BF17D9
MSKDSRKNSFVNYNYNENERTPINLIDSFKKYLEYWPWFLYSIIISLIIVFTYLRYADVIYVTEAKVKLLDDKKNANFSLDISKVLNKSTINLENEIALFKSNRLLEQVVQNLKLNVVYISKAKINSKTDFNPPFVISYALPEDSLSGILKFDVSITKTGYTILNKESGKSLQTKGYCLNTAVLHFPIIIQPSADVDINSFIDSNYEIVLKPVGMAALELSNDIQVTSMRKDSDIISLILKSSDGKHAQIILNNLIKVFEEDGIKDIQQVSRRTIDFVDNRFLFLKEDLNAIEIEKKEYKKSNNLSFIQEDAGLSIKTKSTNEQTLFDVESQLLLVQLLRDNLDREVGFDLLPADIGIQSTTINELIGLFNTTVLQYQKMLLGAGDNNPTVQVLVNSIKKQKKNIENSVKGFKQQLETSRNQIELAQRVANNNFSSLPEKEKVLRHIERQQNLKENLYLLLLQKREEAAINLAVVTPNTKIIDYAITNNVPIYPKTTFLIFIALFLGVVFPFVILYFIFRYDDKIYNVNDIESITHEIPVIGEVPTSENKEENIETNLEIVEAFRTLAHNAEFITPYNELIPPFNENNKLGKIFFVTSSIKGEGKTFVSYNLAVALGQLGKKILLVGTDLRNPQLHKHLDQVKNNKGLSNYLHNVSLRWQDLICKNNTKEFSFDVLLSGDIPPNPILLLSNRKFNMFINEAKEVYDIIIFDTPPTLLVSDALIISKYADTTLYVVRSGMTEKKLLSYSKKLNDEKKLKNMGYVINDINMTNGYNWGYNYGYGRFVEKKNLYKRLFKSRR